MAKVNMTLEEKLEEAIVKDVPYEVPGNWVWVNLKEISQLINGDRGKNYPSKDEMVEVGIPFINAGALKEGKVDVQSLNYLTENKFEALSSGKVQKDDVLYCLRGTIGKNAYIVDEMKGAIASSLCIIRVGKEVRSKYIFYLLNSETILRQQNIANNGTAQPNLSAQSVKEYNIPLPPLKEQQRIVDRIESLFEKLDKANELIEEARDGFEKRKAGILEKAFRGELTEKWRKDRNINSSEYVKFEKMFSFIGGGTPSKAKKEYWDGDISWASVKDIKNANLYDTIDKVTIDGVNNSSTNIAKFGEVILVTRISPGKVTIAQKDVAINQDLKIVRTKMNSIDTKYIFYLFLYKEKEFISKSQGTTVKGITINELNKIQVNLPSLEEQKEIVTRLNKLLEEESKIEELTQLEEQIELIKKSILAKAFRGQIGTNCEEDESALELLKEILSKN